MQKIFQAALSTYFAAMAQERNDVEITIAHFGMVDTAAVRKEYSEEAIKKSGGTEGN